MLIRKDFEKHIPTSSLVRNVHVGVTQTLSLSITLYFVEVPSALFHLSPVDVQACYPVNDPPTSSPSRKLYLDSLIKSKLRLGTPSKVGQAVYKSSVPEGKQMLTVDMQGQSAAG